MKNCVKAIFVIIGVYCSARIFFALGYVSAPHGFRGLLIGAAYLAGLFVAVKCMFGLYDEAIKWRRKRK